MSLDTNDTSEHSNRSESPINLHDSGNTSNTAKKKRRTCKIAGCHRVVKAQGLCQRHGARTKLCRSGGCQKQAQGGSDGYCKFHFKNQELVVSSTLDCASDGASTEVRTTPINLQSDLSIESKPSYEEAAYIQGNKEGEISDFVQSRPSFSTLFTRDLKAGYVQSLPPGWHRNNHRSSRNIPPTVDINMPLEQWEIDLISNESQLINEQERHSPLIHWSHAWGKEYGFHIESLSEYSSYDTTEPQSDVTAATYDNQPINSYEISQESLDAGYLIFLAESMENITQPWFDEPTDMEQK